VVGGGSYAQLVERRIVDIRVRVSGGFRVMGSLSILTMSLGHAQLDACGTEGSTKRDDDQKLVVVRDEAE
jgi:hypothetical protein